MKNISFYTQGCRLNQAETAILEKSFESHGFKIIPFGQVTDIIVVNTCTVTEGGDRDTRRLVNKINRTQDNAKIALIGCQSQILKEKLLTYKNVQWVVGNQQKMALSHIIEQAYKNDPKLPEPQLIVNKIKREPFTIEGSGIDRHHTRANLKIQDGCDFYCAFCTIPFARGPARSRVFEDIVREAIELIEAGHRELVLTGINIGTYEYETNTGEKKTIVEVIQSLLRLEGLDRLRLSSIEPTTIPKEVIFLIRDHPKMCRYLHIPIQAGSDTVLSAMNRHYTMAEFREFIDFVYQTVPDVCIGTDIIVGFPGETKGCFDQTVANLMTMPIHYYHVFSYSERQMARSKKMEDQVSSPEITKRSKILRELSQKQRHAFYRQFLGQTVRVLFEQEKNGYWVGNTDNFLRIQVKSNDKLKNQILPCRLESVKSNQITGTLSTK
jgi:threonylcarbamoyladenosine tRNA methylthiotransferase MtaB